MEKQILTDTAREILLAKGIPADVLSRYEDRLFLPDAEFAAHTLPPRRIDSHKGTYGKLLVAAGSAGAVLESGETLPGMMGAAIFSVRAAYHVGTGLVRARIPVSGALAMTLAVPEAVQAFGPISGMVSDVQAVLVGPGLGKQKALLDEVLSDTPMQLPMVVDADGLNLLAQEPKARGNWILTPHMLEGARLLGKPIGQLMADPFAAALELAQKYQAVAVLKSAATVIADPQGRLAVNRNGNPGMSTAGSGDVLAGAIGGLCAQRPLADLWETAVLGVWLHAAAGDAAAARTGQYALMASDLADALQPDKLIAALQPEKRNAALQPGDRIDLEKRG